MTDPDKAVAVAHLRAKVGAGIRDCKIVLEACNYDEAIAVEILRRKGLAVSWRRQEPHTNVWCVMNAADLRVKTSLGIASRQKEVTFERAIRRCELAAQEGFYTALVAKEANLKVEGTITEYMTDETLRLLEHRGLTLRHDSWFGWVADWQYEPMSWFQRMFGRLYLK